MLAACLSLGRQQLSRRNNSLVITALCGWQRMVDSHAACRCGGLILYNTFGIVLLLGIQEIQSTKCVLVADKQHLVITNATITSYKNVISNFEQLLQIAPENELHCVQRYGAIGIFIFLLGLFTTLTIVYRDRESIVTADYSPTYRDQQQEQPLVRHVSTNSEESETESFAYDRIESQHEHNVEGCNSSSLLGTRMLGSDVDDDENGEEAAFV